MKKTLLATAIAGAALGATAAQAATVYNQDGTQLDIYGNIQMAYYSTKDGDGDSQDELTDNGSTIGFSGQHIINPGLTGYFKAEFEHDADEEKINGGINSGDQAYLGLKGNFGDFRLGSWDPIIDDWVQDPISNNESFDVSDTTTALTGGTPVNDDREGDKLQYMSPVLGGLQFVVGSQFKGDAQNEVGDVDDGGYTVDRDNNASFFGGLKYAVGAFSVAAVYDNLGTYEGEIDDAGTSGQTPGEEFDPGDAYGVNAQYTIGTLRMSAKAERLDADASNADVDFYALGARWGYGYGDLYGSYQYVDAEGDSDFVSAYGDTAGDDQSFNEVVAGVTYNISPAMYTFVEGVLRDRDEDQGDGVSFGAVYSF
ncbi:porin [Salinicola avicenniae]|uniref:porin n=1 Tax=Salinicola avicenniae TaxID=2916836 RepID=UPI0020739033|nr:MULTISPECIES: porin [unclassified Salinicola]